VPGCTGTGLSGVDFCVQSLQEVFNGTGAPPNPLSECQGDCDNDAQCAGDLVCFQRCVFIQHISTLPMYAYLSWRNLTMFLSNRQLHLPRSSSEAVPGCTGTARDSADFCAQRPTQNTVWLKGDNGSPTANFPLGLCEGDCDSIAECKEGLIW
jgi:hypothetical protein